MAKKGPRDTAAERGRVRRTKGAKPPRTTARSAKPERPARPTRLTESVRVTDTTIAAFTPDPDNLRQHTPRSLGVIEDAIQSAGFARSIVIDERNVILAGNGATEAAASVGLTKATIVDVPADTLVAVRRKNLTDFQKRVLAIADNRANELSAFDGPKLRARLEQLTGGDEDQLARLGFRKDDFAKLTAGVPRFSDPTTNTTTPDEGLKCPRCHRLQ